MPYPQTALRIAQPHTGGTGALEINAQHFGIGDNRKVRTRAHRTQESERGALTPAAPNSARLIAERVAVSGVDILHSRKAERGSGSDHCFQNWGMVGMQADLQRTARSAHG